MGWGVCFYGVLWPVAVKQGEDRTMIGRSTTVRSLAVFALVPLFAVITLAAAQDRFAAAQDRFGAAQDAAPTESNSAADGSETAQAQSPEAVAAGMLDKTPLSDDAAAKWAIELSRLRLENAMRQPMAEEAGGIAAAIEPIDRVLAAYPDHGRSAWLRFQRHLVDATVARRRGLAELATPGDDARRLTALAAMIATARELLALQEEVAREIAEAFARRDPASIIDQRMTLRNAIAAERVDLLLRRGELFPPGDADFLAAAEEADRAAVDALSMVRQDVAAEDRLTRMRCEALLRMGQPERAAEWLRRIVDRPTGAEGVAAATPTMSDATRAMAVRIAIAMDDNAGAERLLEAFYGDDPSAAGPAPETDLARLHFLIATIDERTGNGGPDPGIGDWVDAIRRRGGDFAYRRAQGIAAQSLGEQTTGDGGVTATGPPIDARIVMAKAVTKLRGGDPSAAADLLAAAAIRATAAADARSLGIAAAAAFTKAGRETDGAHLLYQIAIAHSDHSESDSLALQAAVMLDRAAEAATVDLWLRETVRRWPDSRSAVRARQWLVQRLEARGLLVEAAVAATPIENSQSDGSDWEAATTRWVTTLSGIPFGDDFWRTPPTGAAALGRAIDVLEHARSESADRCRLTLIALFGDAPGLADGAGLADAARFADAAGFTGDDLVDWLIRMRRGEPFADPPRRATQADASSTTADRSAADDAVRVAAIARLAADGRQSKAAADRSARLILALFGDMADERPGDEAADRADMAPPAVWGQAQAFVWAGDWRAAEAAIDRMLSRRQTDPKNALDANALIAQQSRAARLLAESPDAVAKERALARMLKLGGDIPRSSPKWHAVKLATIRMMSELGQPERAKQLAAYVLLTRPPSDPELKAEYQRWSR